MGLFDKKYCDICGEKMGLLGNRKLEDGNLCKDCAKKLSPWFSDRRSSTIAEIREQLAWREANRERTAQFCTTRTFGERTKLLLDEQHLWFTVTRAKNLTEDNSDVLDFSVITGCRMDIDETRNELKHESKDREGKTVRKSYNPPRYEYYYDFYIIISVNVPYFTEIKFQLNDGRVYIPYESATTGMFGSGLFQSIFSDEEVLTNLKNLAFAAAMGESAVQSNAAMPTGSTPLPNNAATQNWICPSCGAQNSGKFCESCGVKRS